MIKKQLTTIFLSLALAATTAFQPISILAADNLRTETKISLQDRSKKQSTKPIGYTFESKHISTSSKAKGKGATKASRVDSSASGYKKSAYRESLVFSFTCLS